MQSPVEASRQFANFLSENSYPSKVGWLNHYSIQKVNKSILNDFDFIGIDGTLLQIILLIWGHKVRRTSADLFLPIWIDNAKVRRVALVGGKSDVGAASASRIKKVVCRTDGYDELATERPDFNRISTSKADTIICSLGPMLQEEIALEIAKALPGVWIFTAGGWIDQMSKDEQYFPDWVHMIRMGWLLRIFREPRRLLKRYTLDAARFVFNQHRYVRVLRELENYEFWELGLRKIHK